MRFHSIGGWGAITTGKNLGAIIGDLNDLLYERDRLEDELGNPEEVIHVSANPKYGSEKKGAPTATSWWLRRNAFASIATCGT